MIYNRKEKIDIWQDVPIDARSMEVVLGISHYCSNFRTR